MGKICRPLQALPIGGLSSEGFYVGFLLILILVVGIYVAYTGLIKRETTKAIHAVVNFVVVFVLSASFIAYAPDYIGKINEFSADISNASLTLGTKIVLPNSESQGKDSVDLIRTACFPFRSNSRGSCCNTATRMWKALGLTVWKACSQPAQTKTTGRTGKKSWWRKSKTGKTPTLPSQRPSTAWEPSSSYLSSISVSPFLYSCSQG